MGQIRQPIGASIERIIEGVGHFQSRIFDGHRERFSALAAGQAPQVLLVTCSDSRISPSLIMQTMPGDLFVVRNAGNIVPPHGASDGGEEATIEYAVTALGVQHIIVCGHSGCGAMKGLIHPDLCTNMPCVKSWLSHADATRRIVEQRYHNLRQEELLTAASKENVGVQINNLCTYPAVCAKRSLGDLAIHGWIYMIDTGQILVYQPDTLEFLPLIRK